MGIPLASNFDVSTAIPLDSRIVKADLTARDAIAPGGRFIGLHCYVVSEDMTYKLVGGILDANWEEAGSGGGGNGGIIDDLQVGIVTIPLPTTKFIRMLGDGVDPIDSLEGVVAGEDGQEIVIINRSGVSFPVLHMAPVTVQNSLNNIETQADIILEPDCAAWYVYDLSQTAWLFLGMTASPEDFSVATTVSNLSQDASHDVLLVDASAGNVIISLLPATDMQDLKKPLRIKKIDSSANTVAMAPDGSETIDGESSYVIYDQYHGVTLISDGANWSKF